MALKYFSEYKDPENIDYRIEIYNNDFLDPAIEIGAFAVLEYAEIEDVTDPIRGSSLKLDLEADVNITFEDLYSENEQTNNVRLIRDGQIIFNGWINPEGIFQDWVNDKWNITLDCSDGLAYLENLAYDIPAVNTSKNRAKEILILAQALKKINIDIPIHVAISAEPVPYGITDFGTLDYVNLDQSRFVKSDDQTAMSCKEVVESILTKYNAFITQYNNVWWVTDMLLLSKGLPTIDYHRYTSNGVFLDIISVPVSSTIGSHITGAYPHHSGGDQTIEIDPAISGLRINFDYGRAATLNSNPTFIANDLGGGNYDIPNWTITDPDNQISQYVPNLIIDTLPMGTVLGNNILSSDPVTNIEQDSALEVKVSFYAGRGVVLNYVRIKLIGTSDTYYYDRTVGWTQASQSYFFSGGGKLISETITLDPTPVDGDVVLEIRSGIHESGATEPFVEWYEFSFGITDTRDESKGETHTFIREGKPSSVIKDNVDVSTGDASTFEYTGSIYLDNGEGLTGLWRNELTIESPILYISGLTILTLSQSPAKVFSGGVYGFLNYLSHFEIDSLDGIFVLKKYSFNTKTNTGEIILRQVFSTVVDLGTYIVSIDRGENQRPTI